jgi:uncharacterized protein
MMTADSRPAMVEKTVAERIEGINWTSIESELDQRGYALSGPLLTSDECAILRAAYNDAGLFRARVVMAAHGFGSGEYKYLSYPLPSLIADLRCCLYSPLAAVAGRWNAALGISTSYPSELDGFLSRCHEAGQLRPTPLMLHDFNCLHQDLYGEHVFPFQATILLSDPDHHFTGGEFLLTEQRPRAQSRAEVVPLRQGEAVIFAVNHRPVQGSRGVYRATMRHGVSRIRSGERFTLGIIFHDAR